RDRGRGAPLHSPLTFAPLRAGRSMTVRLALPLFLFMTFLLAGDRALRSARQITSFEVRDRANEQSAGVSRGLRLKNDALHPTTTPDIVVGSGGQVFHHALAGPLTVTAVLSHGVPP